MVDIITPLEAFGSYLCALDVEIYASCADKFTSYAGFWYPKTLRISGCASLVANNALMLLRKDIKEGDIGLRGVLRPENPPAEIDRADCKDGELHVFDQTLTIYTEGRGRKVARRYQQVYCVKSGVATAAERISKNRFSASEAEAALKQAPDMIVRNVIADVYEA